MAAILSLDELQYQTRRTAGAMPAQPGLPFAIKQTPALQAGRRSQPYPPRPDIMTNHLSALRIEHRDDMPDYLQVKQRLGAAISAGFWHPAEPLPLAEVLAEHCFASPASVQQALVLLHKEGHIQQNDAGRYLITPRVDQSLGRISSLSVALAQRGYSAGSRWIERTTMSPDDNEMIYLGVGISGLIVRLERLRLANDVVLGLEVSSLPQDVVPDPQAIEGSLYTYLAQQNHAVTTATEYISAQIAGEDFSAKTGIAVGTPLLHLVRISNNVQGRPIELTLSWFRSDYYRCFADLRTK